MNCDDDSRLEDTPAWRAQQWRDARAKPVSGDRLACIRCAPVPGSGEILRAGIFGGIHGDEPSGTAACYELAAWARGMPRELSGFELHLYPECNPTGLAAGTRHCSAGFDLNREFWCGSAHPDVRRLEAALSDGRYDVIIALHEDDTSSGLYGFVSGALLSAHLLEPALAAASQLLPATNPRSLTDSPPAGALFARVITVFSVHRPASGRALWKLCLKLPAMRRSTGALTPPSLP